jgi:restriction system protein
MKKKAQSNRGLKKARSRLAHDVPLEDWLRAVLCSANIDLLIDYQFPTDAHKDQYLKTIKNRSEEDVVKLLRKFLVPSCWLGADKSHMEWLLDLESNDPGRFKKLMQSQYLRRVFDYFSGQSTQFPWEGITWVLDLLPHFPKDALEGLKAYVLAHIQQLPDGRLNGLSDAQEIIRAKFIGIPGSNSEKVAFLLSLNWRTFECLVERLYDSMGYETRLTPPSKDGGRDIIATKRKPGRLEHARIECKFYNEEAVGLGVVQRLLGVVSGEKVNKGVVVTTSRFSKTAVKYVEQNPRLELINGDLLILLMNEHLGPQWPLHIERLVSESERTGMS